VTAVYELVKRPTPVLSIMPRSCNIVFDLLASFADEQGCSSMTMAGIGKAARISRQTVWHALNRLRGARLLDVREHNRGRGNANVYFIRVFATGRKQRKSASATVYVSNRFFSPAQNVNPRLYKESQKKQKQEASKDTSAIKNRGHAMFLARGVLERNKYLNEDEKATALQALGYALFKRDWFEKIKATPGILHDSLHLLVQRRPPGFPGRGAPRPWIFSWLLGLLKSMAEKYRLGIAAVVESIHAGDGSGKCKHSPQTRAYSPVELSTLLASMDKKAPESGVCSDEGRRCRRVVHRRRTWADRGLVPSWGSGSP